MTWNLDLDLVEDSDHAEDAGDHPGPSLRPSGRHGPAAGDRRAHGLAVIEDCAESHGATVRGRMTGSFGDDVLLQLLREQDHHDGRGRDGRSQTTTNWPSGCGCCATSRSAAPLLPRAGRPQLPDDRLPGGDGARAAREDRPDRRGEAARGARRTTVCWPTSRASRRRSSATGRGTSTGCTASSSRTTSG